MSSVLLPSMCYSGVDREQAPFLLTFLFSHALSEFQTILQPRIFCLIHARAKVYAVAKSDMNGVTAYVCK